VYLPTREFTVSGLSRENDFLSKSEANKLDRFREIINDIRYRGETAQKERTEKIIELVQNIIFG